MLSEKNLSASAKICPLQSSQSKATTAMTSISSIGEFRHKLNCLMTTYAVFTLVLYIFTFI